MTGLIHSFESFGSVDGPGVRFVVFVSGCPMRCQYCHNPDTWTQAGAEEHEASEVLSRALRYKNYWGKDGGITVSGGEPLMQIDFVTELFSGAKKKGVHTCLDTSGIAFSPENTEKIDALLSVTDLVMLDIKEIDDQKHKALTGQSNQNILAFAKYLDEKKIPVWIRHVVVPGITLDENDLEKLGEFIGTLSNVKRVETLPYHSMARYKYEKLGIPYPLSDIPDATKEQAQKAKEVIEQGMKRDAKKSTDYSGA